MSRLGAPHPRRWVHVIPVTLFAVVSLNFGSYKIAGDATLYFAFVQRLFGDLSRGVPLAYGFGVGLLSVPFYAIGRLAQSSGVAGSFGHALPAAAMTIGSVTFVVIAWVLSSILLRRLQLPYPELCVTLAVLGSPVWYYASFEPMHAHPPDAALFALAAFLTLDLWRRPSSALALAVGATLAVAMTVRPFNMGALLGLCSALLAYARVRDAIFTAAGAVVTFALLLLIPLAVGADFFGLAAIGELGFYPLSPLRMLFTDHRGLFVWTPVTLLAVIGMAIQLAQRPRDGYFVALSAMAGGILVFYVGFTTWDAGWSFSARFLAGLVPFYAVGLSLLLGATSGRRRHMVMATAVVATAWSIFLGMNHAFGFADQPDGAISIARPYVTGQRSPADFAQRAWAYSRVRHVVQRLTHHD